VAMPRVGERGDKALAVVSNRRVVPTDDLAG
jgi:hypothetical protein